MSWFWEILPLFLFFLFLLLAGYILFAPGPWQAGYPTRFLAGGGLLVYAVVRGAFWHKRWKKRRSVGV